MITHLNPAFSQHFIGQASATDRFSFRLAFALFCVPDYQ
jgi:hypothetical protein